MKRIFCQAVSIILITLLLAEGIGRVWNPPMFSKGRRQFHPELGWKLEPNVADYHGKEGHHLFIETNREGFRDLNYPLSHPRFVKRVAVLGDSFSEAFQVNREETFWSLTAQKLNQHEEKLHWEVLNFGIGDYGTAQEYLLLQKEVWNYHPDFVVLQIFPLNDILNNSLSGAGLSSPQDMFRPYPDPNAQYKKFTFADRWRGALRKYSRFFQTAEGLLMNAGLLDNQRSLETFHANHKKVAARNGFTKEGDPGRGVLMNVFANPVDQIPEIRKGWEATEAMLAQIAESCKERGTPMVAMVIPHSLQLEALDPNKTSYALDPRYAENRIAQFLSGYQIPTLKLMEVFEREKSRVLPYIDGHLNPFGHQIVAEELWKAFLNQELSPTLSIGQVIDLKQKGADRFLLEGFARSEAGVSWSVGTNAKIAFNVNLKSPDRVRLVLNAKPFNPPHAPKVAFVDVAVNGGLSRRIVFNGKFEFQNFHIPLDLKQNATGVELKLRFGNLFSPHELGFSSDDRKLGMAISQLWVERLDTTTK